MHKQQFYEAPVAEMLSVRFEENFCGTNGIGDGSEVTPFGSSSWNGNSTSSYRDTQDYHGNNF